MTSAKVTQLVTERGVIIYLLREVNIALQYLSLTNAFGINGAVHTE